MRPDIPSAPSFSPPCGGSPLARLAAVYNVPLGGAVFVLEVLLGTFELRALVPAIATSAISAAVAWRGLGNAHQYSVPPFALSAPLVAWSIVCGPVFGLAACGFVKLTSRARAAAPKDWRLPVLALINFEAIGWLSMRFPQLLGNGKRPASLSFDGALTLVGITKGGASTLRTSAHSRCSQSSTRP